MGDRWNFDEQFADLDIDLADLDIDFDAQFAELDDFILQLDDSQTSSHTNTQQSENTKQLTQQSNGINQDELQQLKRTVHLMESNLMDKDGALALLRSKVAGLEKELVKEKGKVVDLNTRQRRMHEMQVSRYEKEIEALRAEREAQELEMMELDRSKRELDKSLRLEKGRVFEQSQHLRQKHKDEAGIEEYKVGEKRKPIVNSDVVHDIKHTSVIHVIDSELGWIPQDLLLELIAKQDEELRKYLGQLYFKIIREELPTECFLVIVEELLENTLESPDEIVNIVKVLRDLVENSEKCKVALMPQSRCFTSMEKIASRLREPTSNRFSNQVKSNGFKQSILSSLSIGEVNFPAESLLERLLEMFDVSKDSKCQILILRIFIEICKSADVPRISRYLLQSIALWNFLEPKQDIELQSLAVQLLLNLRSSRTFELSHLRQMAGNCSVIECLFMLLLRPAGNSDDIAKLLDLKAHVLHFLVRLVMENDDGNVRTLLTPDPSRKHSASLVCEGEYLILVRVIMMMTQEIEELQLRTQEHLTNRLSLVELSVEFCECIWPFLDIENQLQNNYFLALSSLELLSRRSIHADLDHLCERGAHLYDNVVIHVQ